MQSIHYIVRSTWITAVFASLLYPQEKLFPRHVEPNTSPIPIFLFEFRVEVLTQIIMINALKESKIVVVWWISACWTLTTTKKVLGH